jgi:hypothetical protein
MGSCSCNSCKGKPSHKPSRTEKLLKGRASPPAAFLGMAYWEFYNMKGLDSNAPVFYIYVRQILILHLVCIIIISYYCIYITLEKLLEFLVAYNVHIFILYKLYTYYYICVYNKFTHI